MWGSGFRPQKLWPGGQSGSVVRPLHSPADGQHVAAQRVVLAPPLPDPLPVTNALGVGPLLNRPGLPCRTRGPTALGREAGECSGSPDPTPKGQGRGEGARRGRRLCF